MLTEKAYEARFWRDLHALRELLGDKAIPDHYFGLTSVSDNSFDAGSRHLQLATLLHEYENDVIAAAETDPDLARRLLGELEDVRNLLAAVASRFAGDANHIQVLIRRVYEATQKR